MSEEKKFNDLAIPLGSLVKYEQNGEIKKSTVDNIGWQPSGNGGKIWSYWLIDGSIIPHTAIKDFEAPLKPEPEQVATFNIEVDDPHVISEIDRLASEQTIMQHVYLLNISHEAKVAIACLLRENQSMISLAQQLMQKAYENLVSKNPDNQGHHQPGGI